MDYRYLTEILFYALLFVFKSSKKEFPFLSFQDFIIVFISKNTPLHSKKKRFLNQLSWYFRVSQSEN